MFQIRSRRCETPGREGPLKSLIYIASCELLRPGISKFQMYLEIDDVRSLKSRTEVSQLSIPRGHITVGSNVYSESTLEKWTR